MASSTLRVNASAARKRAAFKETRNGVIPSSINSFGELTLEPASKAALTAASCKLVVELDSAGTRVFLADSRTGQLVGGPEDLQRLGGIRSFVSRERKSVANLEVAKEVSQLAYKVSTEVTKTEPAYEQPALDNAYVAALRPLQTALHNVVENEKKLDGNNSIEHRELFFPMLKSYFSLIQTSIGSVITELTKGNSVKGKLQEELFNHGVPEWVYAKFSDKNLVLDRSQDLSRVLFPSDPSKGLALSYKEWANPDFTKKQGFLLDNSYLVFALLGNGEFIRSITKIDESVRLSDETNPSVAKLQKTRVVVIPPYPTADRVREAGGKTKSGWKFPTSGTGTEVGAIQTLSTTLIRVYSANLQSVDLINDYYQIIAPGAVKKAATTPTNNFYVQWGNAQDPDKNWAEILLFGGLDITKRLALWRWIRAEMRLSENAQGGKALRKALMINEDLKDVAKHKVTTMPSPPKEDGKGKAIEVKPIEKEYVNTAPTAREKGKVLTIGGSRFTLGPWSRRLTDVEKPLWEKFSREKFPSKTKKGQKSAQTGARLTRLGREAKGLVEEITQYSPHMAQQLGEWLRGFSDLRTQDAAVKLANASFDELFVQELDDEESQSKIDWAEDEEED